MSEENLKVVITGDASDLDNASKKATTSVDKITMSVAEWDKQARALNQQINYTSRATQSLGTISSATAQKVAATSKEVEVSSRAMQQMGKSSSSATNSLFALSGIVQDAPYGFRAIGNNITFFTQQMAYSARESGGFGKAVKAIGGAFLGPAGIIFAISAGISLLTEFIGSSHAAAASTDAFTTALTGSSADFEKAFESVNRLRNEIDLAKKGQLNATTVLKDYNKTLGASTGYANDLNEAESAIVANGNTFIQVQLKKAIATTALAAAAKASFQGILEGNKKLEDVPSTFQTILTSLAVYDPFKGIAENSVNAGKALQEVAKRTRANVINEQEKQKDESLKIAKDALSQAAALGKKLGINIAAGDKSASGLKGMDKVLADLSNNFKTADSLAKIFGASIEQVGGLKMKALSDAMESLAKVSTPEAIAKAKELGAQYDALASKSFLPVLSGGRTGINAPSSLGGVGVPTQALGGPGSLGQSKDYLKAMNDQFRELNKEGELLDRTFENVFSAIAQGANPFQALIQSVEQLIIKLAAAAAAAAILNALTGGSALAVGAFGGGGGFTDIFKGLLHFGTGGFVGGPTVAVIGDAPGGEWVLNQKQISAILNGAGGGRNISVSGQIEADGSILRVVLNNSDRKAGRRN